MKKLLLSIFGIITLGLINFGYCDTGDLVKGSVVKSDRGSTDINVYSETLLEHLGGGHNIYNHSNNNLVLCVITNGGSANGAYAQGSFSINSSAGSHFCYYMPASESSWYSYVNGSDYNVNIFYVSSPMTSSDCQETYDLVPYSSYQLCQSDLQSCQSDINSLTGDLIECESDLLDCQNSSSSCPIIDAQYCMINGLCPSVSSSGTSNIYIYSDNQYTPLNSATNIFVNLPSYVGYSYSYSNGGNDLDIDVGIVVDEDYIDGLNAVQNYKPTSEDFTNLVGTLTPYSKILIFCVFLFIIWAWIKKPFKSKKL